MPCPWGLRSGRRGRARENYPPRGESKTCRAPTVYDGRVGARQDEIIPQEENLKHAVPLGFIIRV
ncbi:hypothetical protein [Microseira wollei]|uniref:Uncharacterized protein n=1 Tax=Microseira wollei NIES-4236 TaxID=2530354 RepID=A0AAV3XLW4_9CYAN|nr:hypothetical protein [Microseira wollei]GET43474.1 hypothetical protein MiSe_82980 [Microseira wollei NIES-4236]